MVVADGDGNQVVAAGGDFQRAFAVGREDEVADQKSDGFAGGGLIEEVESRRGIGSSAFRFVGEHFFDDTQHVARSFARGNIFFHLIGEEDQADAVVVARG